MKTQAKTLLAIAASLAFAAGVATPLLASAQAAQQAPAGFKVILNNVSGQFDWGKLSMILGAPQSGKVS